jgi:hypothetical protein
MLEEKSDEALVAEAQRFYDEKLEGLLEPQHNGDFVAIAVRAGRYMVSADPVQAFDGLRGEGCDERLTLLRVGFPWTFQRLCRP